MPARYADYLAKASKSGDDTAFRHYWEMCTVLALRDGLLELVQSPQDRRIKLATLTSRGLAKLDEARPLWFDAQKKFENIVGEEQAELIRSAMDAISDRRTDVLAPMGALGGV